MRSRMGRVAPGSGVSGSPCLDSLPSPECLLFQTRFPGNQSLRPRQMHLCSAVSVTPGREGGGEAEEGGRHAGLETVLSSFQQTQPVVLSRGRVSRKAPGGEKNLWARASLPLVHMHSTGCQDPTFLAAAVCISCLGKPEAWTSVEEVSSV